MIEHKVLNKGYVELIATMISEDDDKNCAQTLDEMVVEAARVSYGSGLKGEEKDRKLIRYLMEHEHGTPFECSMFKFEVKCPIFVQRQWKTHRWGSFNEISGRYTDKISEDYYIPEIFRTQDTKNKQGSLENFDLSEKEIYVDFETETKSTKLKTKKAYIDLLEIQKSTYESLLNINVSKEQARGILGTAFYTQFVWVVNSRALMNFLILRCENHAQWEIRQYANVILKIFKEKMPWTYDSLIRCFPNIFFNQEFKFSELVTNNDTIDSKYLNSREFSVLSVLQETDTPEINETVRKYFENQWLGYGCYKNYKMIGYCFIKKPLERPETTTVVHSKYRNLGIATKLRNYAINHAIKNKLIKGNVIYSACDDWNIASLKSLLNSGYKIYGFTNDNDGHNRIQLKKEIINEQ